MAPCVTEQLKKKNCTLTWCSESCSTFCTLRLCVNNFYLWCSESCFTFCTLGLCVNNFYLHICLYFTTAKSGIQADLLLIYLTLLSTTPASRRLIPEYSLQCICISQTLSKYQDNPTQNSAYIIINEKSKVILNNTDQ